MEIDRARHAVAQALINNAGINRIKECRDRDISTRS